MTKDKRSEQPSTAKKLRELSSGIDEVLPAKALKQYGALCFRLAQSGDGIEILLITSRGTGRWVMPKGWPMKGKRPFEVAEIEAWQEAGVRGRIRKKLVGSYNYLKRLDNGTAIPVDVDVFQLETTEVATDFKESGQRTLSWMPIEEAGDLVQEPELRLLLKSFRLASPKSLR